MVIKWTLALFMEGWGYLIVEDFDRLELCVVGHLLLVPEVSLVIGEHRLQVLLQANRISRNFVRRHWRPFARFAARIANLS